MATSFRCTIVTPDEAVFEDDVTYLQFPAWDGQQGMLAGQSPLLTQLGVGSLRLDRPGGEREWYLIDGGFAQVQDGGVTLLTERAVRADGLSLEEADAELAEANARVTRAGEDQAAVERDQRRALAKKAMIRSRAQSSR